MKTIVIFVKAPVAGRVKTRLAAAIGPRPAAALARAMARDTYAVAAQVPDAHVVVAYEPHAEELEPTWIAQGPVEWFPQTGSDLGQRLDHAFTRLCGPDKHPVVVIGSDLPALTPTILTKAFALLELAPVVLGPSRDGGYYLVGLKEPHPELFSAIFWSTASVLEQTLKKLAMQPMPYRLLPGRDDIDTPEDLDRLRHSRAILEPYFVETASVLDSLP